MARQAALMAVVLCGALIGGNVAGLRDRWGESAGGSDPASAHPGVGLPASYPYWREVTTLRGGAGISEPTVYIARSAMRWQLTWHCTGPGEFAVAEGGTTSVTNRLVGGDCGRQGAALATDTGPLRLVIVSAVAWTIDVSQEITAPLIEAPTPAMLALTARVVASGTIRGVDTPGRGSVLAYRLGNGRYAVRLVDFAVRASPDLVLQLDGAHGVVDDVTIASTARVTIAGLAATAGSMNYDVPAGIDISSFHSIVVWCPHLRSVYAAAALPPADRTPG